MPFISYAQNLEDVILARLFKDVRHGFYIDVGAKDAVAESVTKAFYDRGWRGINIEPVYQFYKCLCKERPEDVNLPVAAGAAEDFPLCDEIPDTGLSALDKRIAEQHRQKGWTCNIRNISVLPLSAICRQFAPETIHFLKMDVAGAEQQVLLGMDFQQYRPWVVIVEAMLSREQKQHDEHWEDVLLQNGYQYVYFDGLNRFYVAGEKAAEMKPHFAAPPNCFDNYQRYSEYRLQEEKKALLRQKQELTRQNGRLQEELRSLCGSRSCRNMLCMSSVYATPQEQVALLAAQLRQEVLLRRSQVAQR